MDFISPITEWAGLKGDQLRSKRQFFRIQQEETLFRVAEAVRAQIEGKKIKPVPPKILIPALEKASLEDPSDDAMIQRWSELLSSASQGIAVQPRFVSILGELAGSQAETLETIAFNNCKEYNFPAVCLDASSYDFAEQPYRRTIEDHVFTILDQPAEVDELIDRVAARLNRPGVFPELIVVHAQKTDDWYSYDTVQKTGVRRESDLAILESLGLIRRVTVEFDIELTIPERLPAWLSIYYYHLTQLGTEFCEVCCRQKVAELEKIDETSRKSGLPNDS